MRKSVFALTRNFIKATVVNAHSKRAISFPHKKELASRTYFDSGELSQPSLRHRDADLAQRAMHATIG
jgi:hypothetical protein